MSRLKNAPLLEVIFELRWQIESDVDWSKYTYLPGDLYTHLREKYPERTLLAPGNIPPEILKNKVVHRFSSKDNYPLVQVGPGILTYNTTDEFYEWDNYFNNTQEVITSFFSTQSFDIDSKVSPSLNYYDFFKMEWKNNNVLDFLKENLHIHVSQNIHHFEIDPHDFSMRLGYQTALGVLTLNIDRGQKGNQEEGIIAQIKMTGSGMTPETGELSKWLNEAHTFCSDFFKEMTKGELYDSFLT